MKKIFFSLILISVSISLVAQETKKTRDDKREQRKERVSAMAKLEEEGVITYRKHFLGGVKLTTDGYGGFLELGRAQSVKRSLLFQLEITERKHQKEEKQYNQNNNAGPYIYGKINYFYPVKLGVQQQFLLGNKGNRNGVSISANAGGGVSLGLLRPYLLGYDSAGTQIFRGLADDSARFLFEDPISAPNLGTGFNRLKVSPGAYVKAALRFDYGKYNEMVSALEVGITAEYYTKQIPLMVFNKENKFFFSAYVALLFGKRK
ncbi:MAG: hypothetical protein WKF88_04600 [Ferruginibacter sp.]